MTDESTASTEEQENGNNTEAEQTGGSNVPDFEQLLNDEKFRTEFEKRLQSEADKRVVTIERRLKRELADERETVRRRESQSELRELADAEDYEELGRRQAQSLQSDEQLTQAASRVSATIEAMLLERPEFRAIGEDRLQEIYSGISQKGGNVVDFAVALSSELQTRAMDEAIDAATKKMNDAVEARLIELGLVKRDETEGLPGDTVSTTKSTQQATDDDALLEAYSKGEDVPSDTIIKILKKRGISPI